MKHAFPLLPPVWVLAIAATTAMSGDLPSFTITTKRNNDRIEVKAEQDKVAFSIYSPAGISNAVIERKDENKWPETVLLRLHLKGLESFQASNGKITLNAAVSSQSGSIRVWRDKKEDALLNARSPYWVQVRRIGGGKAARSIPINDGHIELRLPRAFFDGDPKAITVNWIDFYRY